MRHFLIASLLLGASFTPNLTAQSVATVEAPSHIEVAVTYDSMLSNVITSPTFFTQGGSIQMHGQFHRGLGIVADVAGLHTGNEAGSGIALNLVTAMFGARYTWSPRHRRYSLYGEGLGGVANGWNSVFPIPLPQAQQTESSTQYQLVDSATSLAVQTGGGMDYRLSPNLAVRVFEVDWLRFQFPNTTTNTEYNLRVGTGLVYRFR